ncbi:MAG TPA: GAF domain-containing protein [Stellaceae bacterium]
MISKRKISPIGKRTISVLEAELRQRAAERDDAVAREAAITEVLQVINSLRGDLAPVFDAILERATRLCEAVFGNLYTFDGNAFLPVAVHGPPDFAEWFPRRGAIVPPRGAPLDCILRGEQVAHIVDATDTEAYRTHPGHREVIDRAGIRTWIGVALRTRDGLLGAIVVYRREVRPFSENEIALLRNFAAQAVIAMENARLLTETRETLKQQTATAEVLAVINASPGNLQPVFDAILDKAHSLCDANIGWLLTFDGEVAQTRASRGLVDLDPSVVSAPFLPGPAMRRLIEGESSFQIPDISEVKDIPGTPLIWRASCELLGTGTYLVVPLCKDGTARGFINAFRSPVRLFSEKEIALLQNFAAQAVIAMENARLLGELRLRTEEVAELNRGLEARVAEQVEELARVGRLKRFLAPQLAELIVSQGDEKILESHRREIVVVFCDLRGYTAFTETAEPEEVLDFLRDYHGALGPLVGQYEGTLDQFSGDGIMVFFNDPVPIPEPAERAVKMAVAMREVAGTLIAAWRRRGRELGFGIGVAQGYATLGQIGFAERSGCTAIGTVCNVAARLCGAAKDVQILVSQHVAAGLNGSVGLEEIGPLAVKGLSQPVVAYNVPLAANQTTLRVIEGGPSDV